MVELLIKKQSPINATDVAGQTPLHHAVAEGHGKFRPQFVFSVFLISGMKC